MAIPTAQSAFLFSYLLSNVLFHSAIAGANNAMRAAGISAAQYAAVTNQSEPSLSAQPSSSNTGSSGAVQFSSSVILFDVGDVSSTVRQNGRAANWCALIANNIKQFGSDKINFVLTQYWMPVDKNHHFDIKHYCYKERGGGPCLKFTQAAINRFEQLMSNCFAVAISQGFKTIMVTSHIDNALDTYQWRNYAKLNPDEQLEGFSYADIQLKPLSKAVNNNLGQGATFLFNVGGELGTSFFGWAGKWLKLLNDSRQLALSNGKGRHAQDLQMGIKVNFERVAGHAADLQGGIKKDLAKQLVDACDYVAISAYAPMPAKPDPSLFGDSVSIADAELQQLGITLKGKDVWYGEFGIGGGTSQYCDKLAKTPVEAGSTPQYGTCWQYNPDLNPWKNKAVRQYMEDYYIAALQWLGERTKSSKWKIKGVFAWNLVSWDVQGVHPLSYAGDGESFKDEKVSQMITKHNNVVS